MFPSLSPVKPRSGLDLPKPGITVISHAQAYSLIEENKALLLDVREPSEYQSGAIISAINLPLDIIRKAQLPVFLNDYKNRPLIVYCRTGRRSAEAAKYLYEAGFTYILDMGGISNWPYGTVTPADHTNPQLQ